MLLGASGVEVSPSIAIILGVIGGTNKFENVFRAIGSEQQLFKTPDLNDYYPPYLSAIIWIVLALALVFYGILRCRKKRSLKTTYRGLLWAYGGLNVVLLLKGGGSFNNFNLMCKESPSERVERNCDMSNFT